MADITAPEIEAYCTAHTTPMGPLFERLAATTREQTELPQMQVGPLEGAFLRMLVGLSKARQVLEIGTFTGYSALAMAEALPADGRLVTLDQDPAAADIARSTWQESGHEHQIVQVLGDAHKTLGEQEGPFDLVFIDADKTGYAHYWDVVLPKVRPGGLIVADNTLWSGRVLEPEDEDAHAIVAFNQKVRDDPRVTCVLLPVRDGMLLARKHEAAP